MLQTEMRNENTTHMDVLDTPDLIQLLHQENMKAFTAVEAVLDRIATATDHIAAAFKAGGRLIYVGAGTSGRLGVLDASECPPTFGVEEDMVVGLIAGGQKALTHAVEGVEDDAIAGAADLLALEPSARDVVVGISAAGFAPYVIGAIKSARAAGAYTVGLVCNPDTALGSLADLEIAILTGAEALTGSTRLKAGTAQKMVLNLLTTGAMIRTGKTYENMMINVRPVNQKLKDRCIRILCTLTGATPEAAAEMLEQEGGSIRLAAERLNGSTHQVQL